MAGLGAENSTLEKVYGETQKISNSLDISKEDLKYLRDIAEREAINRFTTAEISLDMTNYNTVSSGVDIDGMISAVNSALEDSMNTAAEAGGYK